MAPAGEQMLELGEVEGSRLGIEPDDGRQHEDRGNHGVEEKLDGGVDPALVSEDADDESHRDQRGFPEEVKEKEIERDEDADHRRLQQQQKDEELLHAIVDRLPGGKDAERNQEGGQHDQPERDAVDPDVVVDVGAGDPAQVLLIGKAARAGGRDLAIVHRQMQRNQQGDDRDAPWRTSGYRGRGAAGRRSAALPARAGRS